MSENCSTFIMTFAEFKSKIVNGQQVTKDTLRKFQIKVGER